MAVTYISVSARQYCAFAADSSALCPQLLREARTDVNKVFTLDVLGNNGFVQYPVPRTDCPVAACPECVLKIR